MACSCLSFRSRPSANHSYMQWLRHIDICGLSTTPCAIIPGLKMPLSIPRRVRRRRISILDYAAARPVLASPFALEPRAKDAYMQGLRHIDICGLSTTPCAIILGLKTPLTIPPRLKRRHLSRHDYAVTQPVPACPFALNP